MPLPKVPEALQAETRGLHLFASGKPAGNEVIGGGIAPYSITLSATRSSLAAVVAATGTAVFPIMRRRGGTTTNIGTATFNAGGVTATVSYSDTSVQAGDYVYVTAPATPDTTLSDISGLLRN